MVVRHLIPNQREPTLGVFDDQEHCVILQSAVGEGCAQRPALVGHLERGVDGRVEKHRPAGVELGIAEGLETGLSAMRLFEVPVWCACGARLSAIDLPPEVKTVHVFADNGVPGREAAERAADRYTHEGRRVEIRYPPSAFGDWNDVA